MPQVQRKEDNMINPVSQGPLYYEIVRSNPLYKNQFNPNVEEKSKELVAQVVGALMEDFVHALTDNPFLDEDEDVGSCSLSFMEPEIKTLLGRMMVDSGSFEDLVSQIQETVKGGKQLQSMYPEVSLPLPSTRVKLA